MVRQNRGGGKRNAEQALQQCETWLNAIVRRSPLPMFVIDSEHRIIHWNEALEKYSRIKEEEVTGTNQHWRAFYPEERPCMADLLVDGAEDKISEWYKGKYEKSTLVDGAYEATDFFPHMGESGVWLYFSAVAIRDDKGRIIGAIETLEDITESRQAEEEERLMREHFETLVKIYEMRDISEKELSQYVMEAACRMTDSTLAFIGTMTPDESVMDIVAWSESTMQDCRVAVSPIHFPIDKAGIWADAVRTRRPKMVNDYSAPHPGKKGLPEGHVGIKRFLSLPILDKGKVVMVAAVANKLQDYDDADLTRLTLLMQDVWGNLQRRRTEEALRRQAEIIDQTHDSIITTDLEGKVTSWNKGAERLYGYTALEAVGRDVSFIYPEDEQEVLRTSVIAPLKKKGSHEIEVRVKRKSGEHFYVHLSLSLLMDETGTALGMIGYSLDITKRKQAEEALIESEYRFRELFNSMSSGVAVYRAMDDGADFEFVDFNHGAELIENVRKKDVIGKRVTEAFPGVEEFGLMQVFRRVWRTGESEHHPVSLYIDERISSWRENYVYRLPSMEIVAIYEDVTERKQAEEALKQSEQKFHEIFDNANDGIEIVKIQEKSYPVGFIDLNEVACRMLQYTKEELLRLGPLDITTNNFDRPFDDIMRELNEKGHARFETEHIRKDQTVFPVEVNAHIVTILGKKVILSVVRDISERRAAEEALREANKKLNMLSSITRHDILNQIMAVRGYLELSKNIVDNPKLQKYMEIENNAVDTIQRQIEFTRYYQDIGVEEPKWEDAGKIVDEVAEQLDLKGITMENSLKGLEIFADPLIEKVFYNLIENSIRHGESVTAISFSYAETENNLVVSYRDDGVGISEEDKKKLFERGFGKHTGLGLFLSREILSITGITIQETGKPGKGVHFEIMVPKGGYRFSTDMPQ